MTYLLWSARSGTRCGVAERFESHPVRCAQPDMVSMSAALSALV